MKKINGSGGDILKFAGDAIISIWPPNPQGEYIDPDVRDLGWPNLHAILFASSAGILQILLGVGRVLRIGCVIYWASVIG